MDRNKIYSILEWFGIGLLTILFIFSVSQPMEQDKLGFHNIYLIKFFDVALFFLLLEGIRRVNILERQLNKEKKQRKWTNRVD